MRDEGMKKKVYLEIRKRQDGQYNVDVCFVTTGEIRRKIRNKQWLLERLFKYELLTWKDRWDETCIVIDTNIV
jgi:hypothetical protein